MASCVVQEFLAALCQGQHLTAPALPKSSLVYLVLITQTPSLPLTSVAGQKPRWPPSLSSLPVHARCKGGLAPRRSAQGQGKRSRQKQP